jgi:tetratricopeptide (TPR) repeat protein
MSGLRNFLPAADPQPARNDPCPCGSGLKYKKCCAIRPRTAQAAQPIRDVLGVLTDQGRQVSATDSAVDEIIRIDAPRETAPRRSAQPPPELRRYLTEAHRLRTDGRFQEAVPLLRQAAQLDPANATVWNDLGLTLLDCGRLAEAEHSLATAVRSDPKLAVAHYNLGQVLWQLGKRDEAISAYRAAIGLAPKFAEAHYQFARLLNDMGHPEAAAEAFEKAAKATAGTTWGRLATAYALITRGHREEAITQLRRAQTLDPKSPEPMHALARALIPAGRFDEAEQALMELLTAQPDKGAAWFDLVTLRKMTPADRPLIGQMTAALQNGHCVQEDRMRLHFALGKAHDDLQEYEAAIGHFDAANRIRGSVALNKKEFAASMDRRIELFPAGAEGALENTDQRPVFIVGMPRSGTTLVEQILSSHPDVAAGEELPYWSEHGAPLITQGGGAIQRDQLEVLARGYQAVLRGISPDARRVTDKYPFNFMNLGLIWRVFPRAFIIHCRRQPVDTCLSIYTTLLATKTLSFLGNREDIVFYYREYERLMRHWRAALPPEGRFLEVDYEALVSDPEAETRRLVSFCELEWDDACLRPEKNRRTIHTASLSQARQPVYRSSVARWRNYERWLGPFAELLPPAEVEKQRR